jgi:hypothetical protein
MGLRSRLAVNLHPREAEHQRPAFSFGVVLTSHDVRSRSAAWGRGHLLGHAEIRSITERKNKGGESAIIINRMERI